MNRSRLLVGGLATIGLTVAALLLVISSAQADLISVIHTTLEDFNAGILYHTGLTNVDGGEVQLLVVGLAGEWITDTNTTGLPALYGHTAVYHNNHILVIGGRNAALQARNEVYYTTISPDNHDLADWQTTTPLPDDSEHYPHGIYWHASVVLNGYVYVLGGYNGASTNQDTVAFAPINADGTLGNWSTTAPLPVALRIHRAEVVNGRIYVIAGRDSSSTPRAEIYYAQPDPVSGDITSWNTTTTPLPNATFGHMLAVHEDHLYVLGGTHIDLFISPLVSFTVPIANGDITGWTGTTVMENNNYGGAAVSYSGVLYTTGGAISNLYTPSDYVGTALINEDGTVNSWQDTSLVEPARFWHAMVSSGDGWLYVINGHDGSGPIASVLRGVTSGEGDQYAPNGTFRSDVIALPDNCPLVELGWNTTITDTSMMTITMRYRRASSPGDWSGWYGPFPSSPTPGTVTTTISLGGTARFFQYEAHFATSNPHNTPVLNAVELVYELPVYRVRVSKDAAPPSASNVSPGQIITYTLTYSNVLGGITATNAYIEDTVPEYTTYIPGSIHGPGANDSNAPDLRWNLGTLEPEDLGTVGYSVVLTDPLPGGWLIQNRASIDSNEGGLRYSNWVTHTVVMQGPDFVVDEITIDPACPSPGEPVTCQVTVRNQGTYGATDPFWVELYVKPWPSDPPDGPEDHYLGYCEDEGCTITRMAYIEQLPELGQGATYVVPFDDGLTWPGPGPYDIYAQVDVAFDGPEYRVWGAIAEEDETNNIGQISPCHRPRVYLPMMYKRSP
jgi:uncharacterized repeat protein (TIGR01451 family)